MSSPVSSDRSAPAHDPVAAVRARLASACASVGRSPASVIVIAVGKTHPPERIQDVVDQGIQDVGENRVEELCAKQDLVRGARWHLVGRLQSRKARDVVGRQVLVHGLDRRSLADELSRRAQACGAVQRALVQVNVAADPAKGGCTLDEAADLVAYARDLPGLTVEGLMTIPPLPESPEDSRQHFRALRDLRDDLRSTWDEVVHLSMGMSDDFEVAVQEGATMIRLGTALFGARGSGPWIASGGPR